MKAADARLFRQHQIELTVGTVRNDGFSKKPDWYPDPLIPFRHPLMHMKEPMAYLENDDFQMLEMRYVEQALSMAILLPKKVDGAVAVEKMLTAANLGNCLKGLALKKVDITLPKFGFPDEFMLSDARHSLGMSDVFDFSKANLSGMADKKKLFISKVIHKAFVAVDEKGTEAASSSAVFYGAILENKTFKADYPFIFLIRHNQTGEILFMGRVMNPKALSDI